MGWFLRKAVGLAAVTQDLRSYTAPPDDDPSGTPVTHIDFDNNAAGLKGTTERRTLDWKERADSNYLFGNVEGKTRWNTLAGILEENKGKDVIEEDAKYLCEGWLPETTEGEVVESWTQNKEKGWSGWQVWGFATVEGERMLVRRFVVRKGEKVQRVRMVYAWIKESNVEN
jgi:hypothetical protein